MLNAEGEKEAAILAAEAEKEKKIREAEGQAEAIDVYKRQEQRYGVGERNGGPGDFNWKIRPHKIKTYLRILY